MWYTSGGGMAEWSIATVLKTVGRKPRGFESLSLRERTLVPFVLKLAFVEVSGASITTSLGGSGYVVR